MSSRYRVKAHYRSYPSAARPKWVIVYLNDDGPSFYTTANQWSQSRDSDLRLFLKREAVAFVNENLSPRDWTSPCTAYISRRAQVLLLAVR